MNHFVLLFTAAFTLDTLVLTARADMPARPRGQLILTQFVSAPFPHPSRAEGHTYKDVKLPAAVHYSDSSVALFVPDGFRSGDKVDLVIHFHGWRNNVTNALERFNPLEMFTASERNAVFILPQGPRDAPDSSCGKLEDADGFKRFIEETVRVLASRNILKTNSSPGRIILSGHSGGYQVMASIVERGGLTDNIREVWLFDALYARGEKFLAWSEKTGGRLLNIYNDTGGTKLRTEEMISQLRSLGTNILTSTDLTVNRTELTTNRFVFLHTDMNHNDVFAARKTFQIFLETSCLDQR